ncbi:MAG TPA: flagellar assembly protein FliW [bacterium]|jgi:flagellar assembly factor FliW
MGKTEKSIKFNSTRFGEVEIPERNIIHAPGGIIGFAGIERYALLDPSGGESLFLWLQAVDEPDLAFIVTDPMMFVPEYAIDATEPDIEKLGIGEKKPPALFVMVTVPAGNPDNITANLLAPLLYFEEDNVIHQIVLEKTEWGLKHPLVAKPDESGGVE